MSEIVQPVVVVVVLAPAEQPLSRRRVLRVLAEAGEVLAGDLVAHSIAAGLLTPWLH